MSDLKDTRRLGDHVAIPLVDLYRVCRRQRSLIVLFACVCAALLLHFQLGRPVSYEIEASFRLKENSSSHSNAKIGSLFGLMSPPSVPSDFESTLKSRSFLEKVIKEQHLQCQILDTAQAEGWMQRAGHHLSLWCKALLNRPPSIINRPTVPLQCVEFAYHGELNTHRIVKFSDRSHYSIFTGDGEHLGDACLGELYEEDNLFLELSARNDEDLSGRQFTVCLHSLACAAKSLSSALELEVSDDDPSYIDVTITHPDRHAGAHLLNKILGAYLDHLQRESDRISDRQIAYLDSRLKEFKDQNRLLMAQHAERIKSAYAGYGCSSAEEEIEFLARKLMSVKDEQFELLREQTLLEELILLPSTEQERRLTAIQDADLNAILKQMQALRQQRDSLSLAMANGPPPRPSKEGAKAWELQLKDLELEEEHMELLSAALHFVQLGEAIPTSLGQALDLPVKGLGQSYSLASLELPFVPSQEDLCFEKSDLASYLAQQKRLSEMRISLLRQRIQHRSPANPALLGWSSDTLQRHLASHYTHLGTLASECRTLDLAQKRLNDDSLEIAPLSAILTDPLCRSIAEGSHELSRQKQDESHLSTRELKRTEYQQRLNRQFMHQYIEQSLDLKKEHAALCREQIRDLLGANLDQAHQNLAQQEKIFSDALQCRLTKAKERIRQIEEERLQLSEQLAALPEKWIEDHLMNQEIQQSERRAQELAKAVETQVLSHSMEYTGSSILDPALPPLYPSPKPLFLYLVLGLVLGTFTATFGSMAYALAQGIPLSPEMLEYSQLRFLGFLSPSSECPHIERLQADDLESLRRISSFITEGAREERQTVFIAEAQGPRYFELLAELLATRKLRVLCIPCSFESAQRTGTGLLSYLEGQCSQPQVEARQGYDLLPSGGRSSLAPELLSSQRFSELIDIMKAEYDVILLIGKYSPHDAAAGMIEELCSSTVYTLETQRSSDLCHLVQNEKKRAAYIITDRA